MIKTNFMMKNILKDAKVLINQSTTIYSTFINAHYLKKY